MCLRETTDERSTGGMEMTRIHGITATPVLGILVLLSQAAFPNSAFAQHDTLKEMSRAEANTFMDSVQRTAGTPERAWRAVSVISGFGERWMKKPGDAEGSPSSVQYPGVVARLAAIYSQTASRRVRQRVLGAMIHQAERGQAVAFLSNVARQPVDTVVAASPGDVSMVDHLRFPLQAQAIEALVYMGVEGSAALQQLHSAGSVREPAAKRRLDELAHGSFRPGHD